MTAISIALILSLAGNFVLGMLLAMVWMSQRTNEERVNRAEKDRDAATAKVKSLKDDTLRRIAIIKPEIDALEKLVK